MEQQMETQRETGSYMDSTARFCAIEGPKEHQLDLEVYLEAFLKYSIVYYTRNLESLVMVYSKPYGTQFRIRHQKIKAPKVPKL